MAKTEPQKRLKERFFYREHCHGLVMHHSQKETVYRRNGGDYVVVSMFRDQETQRIVSSLDHIEKCTSNCAPDLNLTPVVDIEKPILIETRKFYQENCCAILVHKEGKGEDLIKVYKTPAGGAITTFVYNGREETHVHALYQMEYPSEKQADKMDDWPNKEWKRSVHWAPPIRTDSYAV